MKGLVWGFADIKEINVKRMLVVMFGLLGSTSAVADNSPLASSADPTNWYLGASAGVSDYSGVIDDAVRGSPAPGVSETSSANATGTSLFAGYQFNDYFAVEGQYFEMGTASFDLTRTGISSGNAHATFKVDGFGVAAVGFYPVSDSMKVFGRLGFDSTDLKEDIALTGSFGPNPGISQSASKTTFDAGVGVEFLATQRWALRLGFSQFHNVGDSNVTGSGNVNYFYVGITYRL